MHNFAIVSTYSYTKSVHTNKSNTTHLFLLIYIELPQKNPPFIIVELMIYISLIHCRPPTRGISNTQMVAASRRGCLGMFPNRNTRLLEWTSDYQQPTPPNSECLYISPQKRHFSKKTVCFKVIRAWGTRKQRIIPPPIYNIFPPIFSSALWTTSIPALCLA